ncbi:alpha/beta fold hydrolase [Streptomyces sp. NPDC056749]|uniref:alpha/beta fold hydrolase n=1 Tax=Streptomyces sp. NPDC056749 TaxID=3345936 RepID=UPI0036A95753
MTKSRRVKVGGVHLNILEEGKGPLVILLHGFPDFSYSWRFLLPSLAAEGFHVIAPDQRGYGLSDRPSSVEDYAITQLVDDVASLMNCIGERKAILVGHDWGAVVAWHMAMLHSDRVVGVAAISVPFVGLGGAPPLAVARSVFGDRFYQIYLQEVGLAESELEADPIETFARFMYGLSGDAPEMSSLVVPPGQGLLDLFPRMDRLPMWLTSGDIATYARAFSCTGFSAPLNWYRNLDRNWEIARSWPTKTVNSPAAVLVGDRDPVVGFYKLNQLESLMRKHVPNLAMLEVFESAGHWLQHERPTDVHRAVVKFIRGIGSS